MRLIVLFLAACGASSTTPPRTLDLATDHGLSGLAVAPDGALWTVAERASSAYRIVLEGDAIVSLTRVPIDGVAPDLDLESLEVLADGTFLLGTEGNEEASAALYTASLAGGRLTATPLADIEGAQLIANHGVEGVCGTSADDVVLALETVVEERGVRHAQIIHRRGGTTSRQLVELTTQTGKLAGLDCRSRDDILAIERHFEVTRVIRFDGDDNDEAKVVLDLAGVADGRNFEGIARLPDGRIALVVDNQWRGIHGKSQLVIVR